MNWSTTSALNKSLGLAMMILVVNGVLTIGSLLTLVAADGWVIHTVEVGQKLERVLSMLTDAETGQRGYLLTGDDDDLAAYRESLSTIPPSLEDLAGLTSDNSRQQALVAGMRKAVADKLAELEETVSLASQKRREDAIRIVRSGRGLKAMGEIRRLTAAMGVEEEQLLRRRRVASTDAIRVTIVRFAIAEGLALVLVGCSLYFTRSSVLAARRMEAKLRGLLESGPDALVIADKAGRIVLVNSQTESLFGYTREDLLGREVDLLLPERFRGATRLTVSASPPRRGLGRWARRSELFGRRKDGSEFPVEVSLSPFETDEGLLVSGAIRDITAAQRTAEALRQRGVLSPVGRERARLRHLHARSPRLRRQLEHGGGADQGLPRRGDYRSALLAILHAGGSRAGQAPDGTARGGGRGTVRG